MLSSSAPRSRRRVVTGALLIAVCTAGAACSNEEAPSDTVVPTSQGAGDQSGDLPPVVSSPSNDPADGSGEGGDRSDN